MKIANNIKEILGLEVPCKLTLYREKASNVMKVEVLDKTFDESQNYHHLGKETHNTITLLHV